MYLARFLVLAAPALALASCAPSDEGDRSDRASPPLGYELALTADAQSDAVTAEPVFLPASETQADAPPR